MIFSSSVPTEFLQDIAQVFRKWGFELVTLIVPWINEHYAGAVEEVTFKAEGFPEPLVLGPVSIKTVHDHRMTHPTQVLSYGPWT